MDAKFVQTGNSIDYTPGSAVAAGDVVVIGTLVAIATHDIAAGELGALTVSGVFDIVSTGAITAGAPVYWDGSAATADDDSGANPFVGKAILAAANNKVRVRLSQ